MCRLSESPGFCLSYAYYLYSAVLSWLMSIRWWGWLYFSCSIPAEPLDLISWSCCSLLLFRFGEMLPPEFACFMKFKGCLRAVLADCPTGLMVRCFCYELLCAMAMGSFWVLALSAVVPFFWYYNLWPVTMALRLYFLVWPPLEIETNDSLEPREHGSKCCGDRCLYSCN
jgi:hypothetical protein